MLIVVQHRISDPEAFRSRGEHPQPARPSHWRLHHLLPDASGTRCVCLWDADSVEALRGYVDSRVGDVSASDYFEVDEEAALGVARTVTLASIVAPSPRHHRTGSTTHPFAL